MDTPELIGSARAWRRRTVHSTRRKGLAFSGRGALVLFNATLSSSCSRSYLPCGRRSRTAFTRRGGGKRERSGNGMRGPGQRSAPGAKASPHRASMSGASVWGLGVVRRDARHGLRPGGLVRGKRLAREPGVCCGRRPWLPYAPRPSALRAALARAVRLRRRPLFPAAAPERPPADALVSCTAQVRTGRFSCVDAGRLLRGRSVDNKPRAG
jgi:hypothetical protein